MLSLATKTHNSFGITLMRHKHTHCRCHKDAGISNRQYFCGVRRTDISEKQSVYRWVLTVHSYLPTCFYTRMRRFLQAGKKHLAQQFNFTYRYIDDVLSLKNAKFAEYLEFIYPCELEIKETTEIAAPSSYLDCYLYIDNGKLATRFYDKRDDFNFFHC